MNYVYRFEEDEFHFLNSKEKLDNFPIIVRVFNEYIVYYNGNPLKCKNIEAAVLNWVMKVYQIQLAYPKLSKQSLSFIKSKNESIKKIIINDKIITINRVFLEFTFEKFLNKISPSRVEKIKKLFM